jgi:hypothetical protein
MAYALRTVQFWANEPYRSRQDLDEDYCPGKLSLNHIDMKILAILEKFFRICSIESKDPARRSHDSGNAFALVPLLPLFLFTLSCVRIDG